MLLPLVSSPLRACKSLLVGGPVFPDDSAADDNPRFDGVSRRIVPEHIAAFFLRGADNALVGSSGDGQNDIHAVTANMLFARSEAFAASYQLPMTLKSSSPPGSGLFQALLETGFYLLHHFGVLLPGDQADLQLPVGCPSSSLRSACQSGEVAEHIG